jgi:type II secretory pathway pseudopilin PulG
MRRSAALTLIEVVVVILVVGVLLVVFIPFFALDWNSGGIPRRIACKSNIMAIGKALQIYTNGNSDPFPWFVTDNRWDAATGENRAAEPSDKTNCNVSALLFALVRCGQSPGIFVCPSTADVRDPNTKDQSGKYFWDFSPYRAGGAEHVSYSYQAPQVDPDGNYDSGVTPFSNPKLIILADRTPAYDGKNATFNWASPGGADAKTGMSQNHTGGEMINVLFADMHVEDREGRADVGINNDNIYSAAGLGAGGNALGTNQGPGTLKLSDHRSPRDSFLLGPKKMEK